MRRFKRKISVFCSMLLMVGIFYFSTQPAYATVIYSTSGTSTNGVDVTFEAQFTLSDGVLTIKLINNSPVDGLNFDDLLAGFYFDILNENGIRPALEAYEKEV